MLKSSFWKSFIFFLAITGVLHGAPVVTQISPLSGPEAGGTAVTLIGSGFTGASAVTFGTLPAASFTVNSDTVITATSPASVFGNVNIFVTAPSGVSQGQQANLFTYTGQWKAITANIGSPNVSIIDVSTNTVLATVPTGAAIFNLSITPDGRKAYLLDTVGNNVLPFDLITNTVGAPIPLGSPAFPIDVAITPNGTTAYIAEQDSSQVTPINVATNTTQPPIVFPLQEPFSVAITPDGSRLYMADQSNGDVFLVDTATNTSLGLVFSGLAFPVDLAITPDGTKGYLVQRGGAVVTSFDVATNTILTSIPVGTSPFGMAITPDGTKGYVANNGSDDVTVIDIATDTVVGVPIIVGDGPIFPEATPDSQFVYVPNINTNTVSVIATATNTVITTIVIGGANPRAIAITPDQAPAAHFTATPSNLDVVFDASASVSPVGSITTYLWNFGDGQVLSTTSPIVTHTYNSAGTFLPILQVVNSAGTSTLQVYSSWIVSKEGGPTATTFLSLTLGGTGPSNLVGRRVKNKFVTQTDIIHQLRWTPSSVPVLNYFLFRNREFIATIPPEGPFFYNDHNRRKHEVDVYELVALFPSGQTSSPLITIVP